MYPWFKGFTGSIEIGDKDGRYIVKGKYKRDGDNKLIITDLPIKKWTREYKNYLEELAQKDEIKDIKEFHKDNNVKFVIKFKNTIKDFAINDDELEKKLKLVSSISCNNFVLFDHNY